MIGPQEEVGKVRHKHYRKLRVSIIQCIVLDYRDGRDKQSVEQFRTRIDAAAVGDGDEREGGHSTKPVSRVVGGLALTAAVAAAAGSGTTGLGVQVAAVSVSVQITDVGTGQTRGCGPPAVVPLRMCAVHSVPYKHALGPVSQRDSGRRDISRVFIQHRPYRKCGHFRVCPDSILGIPMHQMCTR